MAAHDGAAPRAWFLVGPTAVGKSRVAHCLAEQRGWEILSADSMQVYRGMDLGTAKPSPAERARVRYTGLDLVEPSAPYSVGCYLAEARRAVDAARAAGRELIVVGGTGLYVKCLTEGLTPLPPGDAAARAEAERILAEGGVAALQETLRRRDPARYAALRDPCNPRRLARALETAGQTVSPAGRWTGPAVILTGLRMAPEALREEIRRRVDRMYEDGLPDEARRLRARYPAWSRTAARAIGYAEALALLDGALDERAARDQTVRRTVQLARRQMTWFRRQVRVDWIDVAPGAPPEETARQVAVSWEQHGSVPLIFTAAA